MRIEGEALIPAQLWEFLFVATIYDSRNGNAVTVTETVEQLELLSTERL